MSRVPPPGFLYTPFIEVAFQRSPLFLWSFGYNNIHIERDDRKMNNPITKIRKRIGLTPQQFATFLRVSVTAIYAVENGHIKNPRTILRTLREKGLVDDVEKFQNLYIAWWEEKEDMSRREIMKSVSSLRTGNYQEG